MNLNMPSFCECEGAVVPNLCKVCSDDQDINMDAVVPGSDGQLTCAAGIDYVKHVKKEAACADFITDSVTAACCIDKESGVLRFSVSGFATAIVIGLVIAI